MIHTGRDWNDGKDDNNVNNTNEKENSDRARTKTSRWKDDRMVEQEQRKYDVV